MQDSIVLLGARKVGKSTVGRLLAAALEMPFCDLRTKSWGYWQEAGFDQDRWRDLAQQEGFEGASRYLAPFHVLTLERGLQEHPGNVIELDPAYVVQDLPELALRIKTALAPYSDVLLLQPAPDIDESERVLHERGAKERINGREFDEHFVRHHSNFDLARLIVYTKDRTPQQSCDEILERITPGEDIVLIGPPGAGKSTLGAVLAKRLGLPNVSMDIKRWDYYKEHGWDADEQKKIALADGFPGVYRYWKRFELYAVERLLADHQQCVFDFGAGHSVYEDDAQFARAQELLAPYRNVVLLLPSPDLEESVVVLRQRSGAIRNGMPVNRFILLRLADGGLARHVFYTEGKTPEEIDDEIQQFRHQSAHPSASHPSSGRPSE